MEPRKKNEGVLTGLWVLCTYLVFPRHFVRIVMRLHTGAVMKFKINDQAEDADVARTCFVLVHHAGGDGDDDLARGRASVLYCEGG